ncbi:ABC transporter ATP-binding protein [Rubellimicrobium arenae]|uniref:ABC transporter ATP-binding protein n=1 Tax=Rubellimicrobium arenae TaxID=2817372 RepID=UPI001B308683|nr:ABC transporter ATP-binding protein [Rubellimicrobium arenae]
MTDALEVDGLSGGYDDYDVVSNIGLTVGASERVGLFGPNGHGKTTILNAISATLARRRGTVRFFGQPVDRARPQAIVAAGLIHVPQANTVFPDMEIQETLELAAWTPRARAARAENLDRVLALFPRLAERRRQLARTLSGGERQMLSIGVGLMCAPRMLMLDEPTLGLSPKLKDELAQAIATISAGGIPILVVEQDVAFVLSLVDRMYFVNHGAITREIGRRDAVDHDEIMAMYFGAGATA